MGEEDPVVEEEVTGVSSTHGCLMNPCSACMEGQETLRDTQVPAVLPGTGSTLSLCPRSLSPLCRDRAELAF